VPQHLYVRKRFIASVSQIPPRAKFTVRAKAEMAAAGLAPDIRINSRPRGSRMSSAVLVQMMVWIGVPVLDPAADVGFQLDGVVVARATEPTRRDPQAHRGFPAPIGEVNGRCCGP